MHSSKTTRFRSILLVVSVSCGLFACSMGGGGYPGGMMGGMGGMGGYGAGMMRGPSTVFASPNGWGHGSNNVVVDENRRNVVVDNNNGLGRGRDDTVIDSSHDRTVAMDNNNGLNRERDNGGWGRGGGFYHPGRI